MPFKYFDSTSQGEVLSRLTTTSIRSTRPSARAVADHHLVTVIGVLIMMLTISWQMTLVALLIVPLSMGIIGWWSASRRNTLSNNRTTWPCQRACRGDVPAGNLVMKAFNGEAQSVERFEG